jgi:hypothetical protein
MSLRRFVAQAKLGDMKRQPFAVILLFVIGLQGSMATFAATSPLMAADCQTTSVSQSDASRNSCCPKGQHATSCCLDLCLSTVGAIVSPLALIWFDRPSEPVATKPAIFSSRGDSPLIRPPIP